MDIVNQSGNVAASCAAVAARNYTGGGKTDWFLPSKDELAKVAENRSYVGFDNGGQVYATSSEISATGAWHMWDNYAMAGWGTKDWSTRVRPIRMGSN